MLDWILARISKLLRLKRRKKKFRVFDVVDEYGFAKDTHVYEEINEAEKERNSHVYCQPGHGNKQKANNAVKLVEPYQVIPILPLSSISNPNSHNHIKSYSDQELQKMFLLFLQEMRIAPVEVVQGQTQESETYYGSSSNESGISLSSFNSPIRISNSRLGIKPDPPLRTTSRLNSHGLNQDLPFSRKTCSFYPSSEIHV